MDFVAQAEGCGPTDDWANGCAAVQCPRGAESRIASVHPSRLIPWCSFDDIRHRQQNGQASIVLYMQSNV